MIDIWTKLPKSGNRPYVCHCLLWLSVSFRFCQLSLPFYHFSLTWAFWARGPQFLWTDGDNHSFYHSGVMSKASCSPRTRNSWFPSLIPVPLPGILPSPQPSPASVWMLSFWNAEPFCHSLCRKTQTEHSGKPWDVDTSSSRPQCSMTTVFCPPTAAWDTIPCLAITLHCIQRTTLFASRTLGTTTAHRDEHSRCTFALCWCHTAALNYGQHTMSSVPKEGARKIELS